MYLKPNYYKCSSKVSLHKLFTAKICQLLTACSPLTMKWYSYITAELWNTYLFSVHEIGQKLTSISCHKLCCKLYNVPACTKARKKSPSVISRKTNRCFNSFQVFLCNTLIMRLRFQQ